ncbi:DUF5405 family protein [Enterobacter soli]|uniref:DUF5405 family protein n=1 Tax=Enterobacter TaxID=547 RepID=UPI00224B4DE1|nr:DUF5405 family protein [Enterobacter kobei]UZQ67181.1 DUF5405 family protein [Enterobacter kobei]
MSINIEIGNKWVITSDKFQFILNEKKVVKSGKNAGQDCLETIGYYTKLSQLISGLALYEIQTSEINSLKQMAGLIDRLALHCEASFKEMKHD